MTRHPRRAARITFVRKFQIPGRRPSRFDADMVWSNDRRRIIDYLGTHQHLAVDLDMSAEPDRSLPLTTHAQRLHEGRWIGFSFPMLFRGKAVLRGSWDDDAELYRIHPEVRNPIFGFLFGYAGTSTTHVPARHRRLRPAQACPPRTERLKDSRGRGSVAGVAARH